MISLAFDENFNNDALRGLRRRNPEIDVVRIRDTDLAGAADPDVLEWAAREGRVLVTHDVRTITHHAYERVRAGKAMPGVIEAAPAVPISAVIEHLLLLAECSRPGEWEGQILFLPLR